MDAEKYAPAIDLLVAAQKQGEDTFEVSELLVECYQQHVAKVSLLRKRGVGKKMKQAMEHSVALRPQDAGARKRLIRFHLNAPALGGGSKDEARRLIREFPGLSLSDVLVYEARVDQAEKNPKGAKAKLEKALSLEPGHGDALIMRGNMQIADRAYGAAIATFERCVETDPENMGCHYLIGKVAHVGKVQVPKGIASLERFIAAGSDDKPLLAYAHYRLGEIHARKGDVSKARKHLEQAVAINDVDKAKSALKKLR
ncbi:hypothetical protein ABI59_09465 [Acidobacteria bacterium Mor1]|nr:hypothetical protein ABI59_09465 [Acidobacteria bacterium Mor1]